MASTHADARTSLDCPGSPWIGSIDPRDHPDVAAAVAALGDEVISPYYLWCLQDGFVARAHEEALGSPAVDGQLTVRPGRGPGGRR